MKTIFFGSDDFAVEHLKALCASKHKVLACVTQPDKPKGRHLALSASPVKEFTVSKKIPVLEPHVLTDKVFLNALKDYTADVFAVVAYGKILPSEVLSLPKTFCINIHGSLLPKYRGAAPINWAIINGEEKTGVTAIKMNSKMDAGDIIAKKEIAIHLKDTAPALRVRLAKLGSELLLEVLGTIESNTYQLIRQDEKAVTFAGKLTKELGHVDWKKSALEIDRLVRGLLPWPAAYTFEEKKLLKILEAKINDNPADKFAPGQVTAISKSGIDVATGKGALRLTLVHPESSKMMPAHDFVVGHKLGVGFKFQ